MARVSQEQRLSACALEIDQFNLVAVRVFNKCNDCPAMGHWAGFADDIDAFRLELIAGLINIIHAQSQMPESGTLVVA